MPNKNRPIGWLASVQRERITFSLNIPSWTETWRTVTPLPLAYSPTSLKTLSSPPPRPAVFLPPSHFIYQTTQYANFIAHAIKNKQEKLLYYSINSRYSSRIRCASGATDTVSSCNKRRQFMGKVVMKRTSLRQPIGKTEEHSCVILTRTNVCEAMWCASAQWCYFMTTVTMFLQLSEMELWHLHGRPTR